MGIGRVSRALSHWEKLRSFVRESNCTDGWFAFSPQGNSRKSRSSHVIYIHLDTTSSGSFSFKLYHLFFRVTFSAVSKRQVSLNTFQMFSDLVFLSIIRLSLRREVGPYWTAAAQDVDFKLDYRILLEGKKQSLPNAPHPVPLKQSMNLLINLASTFLHLYIDPRRLERRHHSISIWALNSFGDRSAARTRPGESHIETGWYGDGNWFDKWRSGWEELWSSWHVAAGVQKALRLIETRRSLQNENGHFLLRFTDAVGFSTTVNTSLTCF